MAQCDDPPVWEFFAWILGVFLVGVVSAVLLAAAIVTLILGYAVWQVALLALFSFIIFISALILLSWVLKRFGKTLIWLDRFEKLIQKWGIMVMDLLPDKEDDKNIP